MIIPESGKPADLNKELIKTVSDADRVILWLSDVISDMDRQLRDSERSNQTSEDWLKKVKAARWWATHIRHQVREIRDGLAPDKDLKSVMIETMCKFLDDEDLDEFNEYLAELHPHLSGVDVRKAF